jgi:hypothetical protein
MTTDDDGRPYVATYWRPEGSGIPQYQVVYFDGKSWKVANPGFRNTPFSLKGGGTKRIPISRPQLVVKGKGRRTQLFLIFRDEERGSRVSMAYCENLRMNRWPLTDLIDFPVDSWEPSYDTELWRNKKELNLFVQRVEQVDGEGRASVAPQKVYVLEVEKPQSRK